MTEDWAYSKIDEIIHNSFTVTSLSYKQMTQPKSPYQSQVIPIYEILKRSDMGENLEQVNQTLEGLGYMSLIRSHPTHESRGMLYIFPIPERMKNIKQDNTKPLILFVVTVVSVFVVGLMTWNGLGIRQSTQDLIKLGVFYVIGLMGIVGIHELGHMLASRAHRIKASWPYFIPLPIGLGTMGAFISQKTPMRTRNQLFDVGLAGPIFGFVISVIFTILGLMNSIILPSSYVPEEALNLIGLFSLQIFNPESQKILLFEIFAKFLVPVPSGDSVVIMHPFAFAGIIGFLLTWLNLNPLGQTDGGHVARSIFSEEKHRYITYISAGILILIGYWLFALLLLYMYSQTGHAGPLDDVTELSLSRKLIAVGTIVLYVICLPLPADFFNILFPFFN